MRWRTQPWQIVMLKSAPSLLPFRRIAPPGDCGTSAWSDRRNRPCSLEFGMPTKRTPKNAHTSRERLTHHNRRQEFPRRSPASVLAEQVQDLGRVADRKSVV